MVLSSSGYRRQRVHDAVADLSFQVAQELGITVVPLNIHFGTEVYRDGVDLTAEQFYERLVDSNTAASWARPSGTGTQGRIISQITLSGSTNRTFMAECQE